MVTDRGGCFFRNFRTSSAIHIEKTPLVNKEKRKGGTTLPKSLAQITKSDVQIRVREWEFHHMLLVGPQAGPDVSESHG